MSKLSITVEIYRWRAFSVLGQKQQREAAAFPSIPSSSVQVGRSPSVLATRQWQRGALTAKGPFQASERQANSPAQLRLTQLRR
jgi:hypothetical protein